MTLDEAKSAADFDKITILSDEEFTAENDCQIDKDIILKLKDKGVSRDILIVLYFCISEATSNTIFHGNIDHGHITVGIGDNSIRILIYDEGDGIYETLKGKYPHKSKVDVLKVALSKAISSDNGYGNGLYAWSQLSKNIAFYFEIISNDVVFVPYNKGISYLCTHKGTILNIDLPLTTDLTWDKILNDDAFKSLEDDYKELIEENEDEGD